MLLSYITTNVNKRNQVFVLDGYLDINTGSYVIKSAINPVGFYGFDNMTKQYLYPDKNAQLIPCFLINALVFFFLDEISSSK